MEIDRNRKRSYCIFSAYNDKDKVTHAFKNGATKATVAFRANGGNLYRVRHLELKSFVEQFNINQSNGDALIWRTGDFYLTCHDLETALKMLNTKSWSGIQLTTRLVEYDIVTKYVVKNVHAIFALESIAEELDRQGIIWQQIIRFRGSEHKQKLPVILIKELGKVQRDYIEMWSLTYITERYVEKPIVCKKCLKFGHHIKKCGGTYVCSKCGENHKVENCTKTEVKCVRCDSEEHDTFCKQCPKYIKEKEVINIKIREQIPYHTALSKYEEKAKKEEESKKTKITEAENIRRLIQLERMRNRTREIMAELRRRLNNQPEIINYRSRG